jgi:hypothetical protein
MQRGPINRRAGEEGQFTACRQALIPPLHQALARDSSRPGRAGEQLGG